MFHSRSRIGGVLALAGTLGYACQADLPATSTARNFNDTPSRSPAVTAAKTPTASTAEAAIELERARELWQSKKIESYEFSASLYVGGTGYYAEPVKMEVREKTAVSIEPVDKSNKGNTDGYSDFQTVEMMFDVIDAAIKQGLEFKATYSRDRGYPQSILIFTRSGVTDAYKRFKVHELKVIK